MSDPFETYDLLCDSYIRYIQTILGFNSDKLEEERDKLLRENRLLFQAPRFEPIMPYPSSGQTLSQLCNHLGLVADIGEFLAKGGKDGIAPKHRPLYEHQASAFESSVIDAKDVVVTTGTGSGKTECFLLPIFSYLINESTNWDSFGLRNANHPWWQSLESRTRKYVPQRQGENRPAALRALILYPLNALVEDQLMRLRHACDSPEARRWLDFHRGGNRFYFGRYTRLTPVSGHNSSNNLSRLRSLLEQAHMQAAKVYDSKEKRYFFPSTEVDTAEMWSRWDMQQHPPDILITNYSMLNIMLIRDLEEPVFEKTKKWLEHEDSLFHLVVDELHSYRGTAGSEVAYLLRTFFDRLGLDPDSPKLRIIASSASLEGDEGNGEEARTYLRQFFARRKDFSIIGSPLHPDQSVELQKCLDHAAQFEDFDRDKDSTHLDEMHSELDIKSAVAQLCHRNGKLHASTLEEMVENANEGTLTPVTESTIRGLIRYLIDQKDVTTDQALLPLRVHYFFKNFEGLWACSNPNCQGEGNAPLIGKMFASRRVLCDECGSRVLELLICQTCGDLFLGGYKQSISKDLPGWYLSGDSQELEGLPEKGTRDRKYETYAIFWRSNGRAPDPCSWDQYKIRRRWARAKFSPAQGTLEPDSSDYNGYFYKIDHPDESCSEIPKSCPYCGDEWAFPRERILVNGKEQVYSPIRHMGTGLEKVIQILTQTLQTTVELQSKRKTIIFSDSRQDAAKHAVGIQWSHHQDMIRLIAVKAMRKHSDDKDLKTIRDFQRKGVDFRVVQKAIRNLREKFPDKRQYLDSLEDAFADEESLTLDQENQLAALESNYPFTALQKACFDEFINLGMNPGGYGKNVENIDEQRKWQTLCDWESNPVALRPTRLLERHHERLIMRIESEFKRVIAERILFARKDMGLEGLGLAWCEPSIEAKMWPIEKIDPVEMMAAVTRILGERRYTEIYRPFTEHPSMPKFVKDYLVGSANKIGCSLDELTSAVSEQVEASISFNGFLLRVENLNFRRPQEGVIYQCDTCRRKHLYKAGGICTNTKCRGELKPIDRTEDTMDQYGGYYTYQADPDRLGIQPYRFHCEELSAQTDSEERPNRQRWFQDVILNGEIRHTDEIDLLSVTTTMEAGVDIGGLSMVLMGNVPPQRFNYQQRVGRAGRRGDSIAYALTLCRLRTHDDHYFTHSDEITNASTPLPYLDLRSQDILKRVLSKEILYNAFRQSYGLAIYDERNVHGEFGKVSDWTVNRDTLIRWIENNREQIERIVRLLVTKTELEAKKEELSEWGLNMLVHEINDCVEAHPFEEDDLSQSLAESGILPMFGFPTGVRLLYHDWPKRSNWPPKSGVVDRDIEIAVSEFAPGSETVKDKKIHTSIGIVSFRPEGHRIVPECGIAREKLIGFCHDCKAIFFGDSANEIDCRICGSQTFNQIQALEPKGFLTNFKPDDAHESFHWTPRSTYSRLPSDTSPTLQKAHNFSWAAKSNMKLVSVNTNSDRLFTLQRQSGSEALISAEVCNGLAAKNDTYTFNEEINLTGDEYSVALFVTKTTDVLLMEVDEIPVGLMPNQRNEYWRAALYSFGFLFRQFAASRLDISPDELRVEIRPIEAGTHHRQQVFLADSLANGAGYCHHLGESDSQGRPLRLIQFLVDMVDPTLPFAKGLIAHGSECDSSCYSKGCMRDYSNMPYHPFLDWRLGLDVARLYLEKGYQMNLQSDHWLSLVNGVERNLVGLPLGLERNSYFDLPVFASETKKKAFILHHPLVSVNGDSVGPHHTSVVADLNGKGIDVGFINIFDVIRRISMVMNQVGSALNRRSV